MGRFDHRQTDSEMSETYRIARALSSTLLDKAVVKYYRLSLPPSDLPPAPRARPPTHKARPFPPLSSVTATRARAYVPSSRSEAHTR